MPELPDETPEREDRRREARAPVTLKVDYKRLNTFFADYTKNISKGGTFIQTADPLPIGTEFIFVLTVPKTEDATNEGRAAIRLQLTGEVKWTVKGAAVTAENPAGMGVQFVFKDEAERQRVAALVSEWMRSSLGDRLADKLLPGSR